jgi:hypothetical protein
MKILNLETNKHYDLEQLPDELEDDIRFAILDNSNTQNPDFYYIPLIFLESFNAPAVVIKVGDKTIKLPVDWQVLIGEADHGDLETLPLSSLNDRGFSVFEFNPLSSYSPSFLPVEIVDIYQDVTWYVPKLKNGQFLCVPIDDSDQPRCLYVVKDISRNCEVVDYGKVF